MSAFCNLFIYLFLLLMTGFHFVWNRQHSKVHKVIVAFVALLFYVHGKHLRSCRDGQLT